MGGPAVADTPTVRSFLHRLFSDPEIIVLPRRLKPFQALFAHP
jgi:protoheme ferro-lyase